MSKITFTVTVAAFGVLKFSVEKVLPKNGYVPWLLDFTVIDIPGISLDTNVTGEELRLLSMNTA